MASYLEKIYRREMFNPGVIGLFINPFYIIRRGLYTNIQKYAQDLTGRFLDFGCGRKPYESLFKIDEYVGLDIEVSGHDHKDEQIDVYYDGKRIPFEDNYFDSIFSSEVFEHVFELDDILKELNRVCKLNGKLLITVPFAWQEHEIPFDFGRYSSFGIKHVLERSGFRILGHEKSTCHIETIFQMWNAYVADHIFKNKWLLLAMTPFFIAPITIIGLIVSRILPRRYNYFHNNIVLAEKAEHL